MCVGVNTLAGCCAMPARAGGAWGGGTKRDTLVAGGDDTVHAHLVLHLVGDVPAAVAEMARTPARRAARDRHLRAEHFREFFLNPYFPSIPEIDLARFPDPAQLLLRRLRSCRVLAAAVERFDQPVTSSAEDVLERARGRCSNTAPARRARTTSGPGAPRSRCHRGPRESASTTSCAGRSSRPAEDDPTSPSRNAGPPALQQDDDVHGAGREHRFGDPRADGDHRPRLHELDEPHCERRARLDLRDRGLRFESGTPGPCGWVGTVFRGSPAAGCRSSSSTLWTIVPDGSLHVRAAQVGR